MSEWEEKEVLVTVKTYPNLSQSYDVLVCTAGITRDGEWIRLYPVPWWDLEDDKRFRKFDWIRVKVKEAQEKLNRKESHYVKEGSIEIIDGLPVSRGHAEELYEKTGKKKFETFGNNDKEQNWKKRIRKVEEGTFQSVEELRERKNDNYSLGAIKPVDVENFYWEEGEDSREWEKDLVEGTQQTLGQEEYETPLEKIGRVFKYEFSCDDPDCEGHNMMAEDWEIEQAWRKWREKYDGEEEAFEMLEDKFYRRLFHEKEGYLFLGTESQYNRYLIIGFFYPPADLVEEVNSQTSFNQF